MGERQRPRIARRQPDHDFHVRPDGFLRFRNHHHIHVEGHAPIRPDDLLEELEMLLAVTRDNHQHAELTRIKLSGLVDLEFSGSCFLRRVQDNWRATAPTSGIYQ